jgi:hypothetical protein
VWLDCELVEMKIEQLSVCANKHEQFLPEDVFKFGKIYDIYSMPIRRLVNG